MSRPFQDRIQSEYVRSLSEYKQWKAREEMLAPFCESYQQMTQLIHRAGLPNTTSPVIPPTSGNNSSSVAKTIIWIVLALLIVLALIFFLK